MSQQVLFVFSSATLDLPFFITKFSAWIQNQRSQKSRVPNFTCIEPKEKCMLQSIVVIKKSSKCGQYDTYNFLIISYPDKNIDKRFLKQK